MCYRYSFGDTKLPFCLQSTSKALNYAMAVSDMGPTKVHKYVGQEPSGRSFNELTLDHNSKYTLSTEHTRLCLVICFDCTDIMHTELFLYYLYYMMYT